MVRKYDDKTDLVLEYFPHRRVIEVRIPLPFRDIEMSDKPFGTTELEPQYGVSFVDEVIYKANPDRIIRLLQDQWYRKLAPKDKEDV